MIRWFLDNTLEVATAYLRVVALLLPLGALASFLAAIWAPDVATIWRLAVSGALLLFIGAVAGYIGFYLYGNEDWRDAWPSRQSKKSATS